MERVPRNCVLVEISRTEQFFSFSFRNRKKTIVAKENFKLLYKTLRLTVHFDIDIEHLLRLKIFSSSYLDTYLSFSLSEKNRGMISFILRGGE